MLESFAACANLLSDISRRIERKYDLTTKHTKATKDQMFIVFNFVLFVTFGAIVF